MYKNVYMAQIILNFNKKPLVIRTSAGLLLFTKEGGEGSDGFSLSVISVGSMEQ